VHDLKPAKFAREKGVFIRDSKNGQTVYIRVGRVDKFGVITLFKEVVQ